MGVGAAQAAVPPPWQKTSTPSFPLKSIHSLVRPPPPPAHGKGPTWRTRRGSRPALLHRTPQQAKSLLYLDRTGPLPLPKTPPSLTYDTYKDRPRIPLPSIFSTQETKARQDKDTAGARPRRSHPGLLFPLRIPFPS